MAEIKLQNAFRVDIIESESGWGSKVDDTKYFDTEEDALTFCKEYNDEYNPPGPTPAWYMIARYQGKVR
jgi:hypothetical protein